MRQRLLLPALAAGLLVFGSFAHVFAQAPATDEPPTGYRRLAAGVETKVAPDVDVDDTLSSQAVVELLANNPDLKWTPHSTSELHTLFRQASATDFHRAVWYLEFDFKPLRMIYVDMPAPGGKAERELIWYMVYRVKNNGQHLRPVRQADGSYEVDRVDDMPVRFLPQFTLESRGNPETPADPKEPEAKLTYRDEIIPLAVRAIQQREDPNRKLLNSVEISSSPIPLSTETVDKSVWGVATWRDIDLKIDFFSIYVSGLTNAYRWDDPPGAYKPGADPTAGRTFKYKTLRMNFWRPGDEFDPQETDLFFGIPGQVDYQWEYIDLAELFERGRGPG